MKRKIDESTKETSGGFVDIAGINENWTLDSWGFGSLAKDGTGKPALYFNFKNGAINVRLVEWDIDEAQVIKNNQNSKSTKKISDEEAIKREVNASNGRIKQILGCYVAKDSISIDADDYAGLAKMVVANLDKYANKTEMLRMKAIYGKTGFLEISTKNGRFIQPAKENNLLVLTDWEKTKLTKDTPTKEGEVADNKSTVKGEF